MGELEFSKSLFKLYHNVIKLEEKTLKTDRNLNLTINELHLIECIKLLTKGEDGPTISAIASELDITRPSTTVAVNKLESKKFVEKVGCVNDGRSVRVKLTAKGEKAFTLHQNYHTELAKNAKEYFSSKEYDFLTTAFSKLDNFFGEKLEKVESEDEDF